jgi:hypothetical protein
VGALEVVEVVGAFVAVRALDARAFGDLGVFDGGAELGVVPLGAAATMPAGATAAGAAWPCALARQLSPTTTTVSTVMPVVTRCLIGVTM